MVTLKLIQSTWLKLRPIDGQSLPDSERVWVTKGTTLDAVNYQRRKGHLEVRLVDQISRAHGWFIRGDHVEFGGEMACPPTCSR